MFSTASSSNDHMTAVSAMLRDAEHKAKSLGPDDIDTYIATYEAIVTHIEQQIRNFDSTCAAIAFEHVADAFASKQVWKHARETYSQALQVINAGTKATSSPSVAALNESAMQHPAWACCCTFTVLQKFANACMHLKDYDGAWKAHQECLGIVNTASFPLSDSRIVTVVGNMGHVQYAKGGAAAVGTSITLYKQCLRLQRSLSSRDLLAEANTMSKIGCIFRQRGRFDTAITWYEGAIEVRTEILGDNHAGLSSDLLAIGNIHYRQGELDCALAAFSECLSLDRSSSPDNDPCFLVHVLLDKMGAICVQLDEQTFARACYEDLVSIARAEAIHSRSLAMAFARSLYNLAVIHNAEGRLSKAIDSAEESIQVGILESSLASKCLAFIICLYLKKGDAEKVQMYQMISDLGEDENSGCRPAKRCKKNKKNQGAAAA